MSDAEHEMLVDNAGLRAELAAWHRAGDTLRRGPHAVEIVAVLAAEGLVPASQGWAFTDEPDLPPPV